MLHLCRRKSWAAVAARRYNLLEAIGSSDAVDSSDPTLFAFRVAVTLADVQSCTTSFRQEMTSATSSVGVCGVWDEGGRQNKFTSEGSMGQHLTAHRLKHQANAPVLLFPLFFSFLNLRQ